MSAKTSSAGPSPVRFLNIFTNGDIASSSGDLYQSLTTLTMKKFIGFNLSPLRLVLSAGIAEKSLSQSSLLPTHWVIILVFSRFNSPISQPLLMRQRLWSFGPFLDSVWYVHACSPELDAVLQTWSLQCWGQGKDPPPLPAGDAFPNAAQGTAGCLCHEGELLARGQLTGHPHHQVPFCKADFQLVGTQHILVLGADPPQGQDFGRPFVDLREILVGPFLQPAEWLHAFLVYQLLLPIFYHL